MCGDIMAKYAFTLAELEALVGHVNSLLGRDYDLDCLPIKPAQKLFQAQKNGILFCKLLNRTKRGTVPPSKIHKTVKNIRQALENQMLVIEGAKNVGCEVRSIGAEDLWSGKEYLVLEILWQIVKAGLLSHVNVDEHPELAILRKSSEDWATFSKLSSEEHLKRWVNFHIRHSNHRGPDMKDFAGSLKDSVIYCHLLNQLAPERCSLFPLEEDDLFVRAKNVLYMAESVGCRKYLTPHELVKGNPRLNLAFIANLFHLKSGLTFSAAEMDTERLTDEFNTALNRCRSAEEERNILQQARNEMLDELKDTRQKLEEALKEMEILKRKATRLEDENNHFNGVEEMLRHLKAENALLQNQLDDMKAVEGDSLAIMKNQEITINSLKKEKEVLEKENAEKINELENKISAASRKQTTMVLQREAITHERDLLKRKHDKCEAELRRLQVQVDRRQRHVQQLRQLFKSFVSDKVLAETIYGKLDTNSLQKANGKVKVLKFCHDGGRSGNDMASRVFLLKDNFLFVYDVEKEGEPLEVLRLDQTTVERKDNELLILKFTQKEFSYHIKVSPASQLKDLLHELEISADWWTERQRTSPGSRFKDVVRTNLLSTSSSKRNLNLKHASFITADV